MLERRRAVVVAVVLAAFAAQRALQSARRHQLARPRRQQGALEVLDTAGGVWYRVLSRDAAACRIEQYVRASAPGFDPRRFPGGPPLHRHTASDETFSVVAGTLGLVVEGRATALVAAGETAATVPAGARHTFFNAGAREGRDLHVTFELRPCGAAPAFFENLAGLLADDGGGSLRRVGALQAVLLYASHGAELATAPRWAWRAAAAVLPPVARLLGYRAAYPEYSSAGGWDGEGGRGGGGGGGGAESGSDAAAAERQERGGGGSSSERLEHAAPAAAAAAAA